MNNNLSKWRGLINSIKNGPMEAVLQMTTLKSELLLVYSIIAVSTNKKTPLCFFEPLNISKRKLKNILQK